ncbi:MAG: asparagine synthase (glutamine-hydrolyzing) [Endozoicomonadaceae bacterium]|nr:asparagine synthase (glutamine-hydrolyzing) [Endozoicomonadaceae bacterium]
MCGFSGFLNKNKMPKNSSELLKLMGVAIANRGPDSSGEWINEEFNVGFSHRRLAVIDPSPAGRQPMYSLNAKYIISFNGEIYNHLDLRCELEKSKCNTMWRGHSDTETLLMGFELWGVNETIKKTIGMFSFALWDNEKNELTLGRDRLGEKPLYYGWQGDTFLFGSELKALKVHPDFKSEINRNSVALQLRYSYIPAPYSIYAGINKLLPGCLLVLNSHTFEEDIDQYWSFNNAFEKGKDNIYTDTLEQAADDLEDILKKSIKQQMVADVPLGAFLSGGIDSSTVVALMQSQSDKPIKTFSIGFNEEGYNEAVYAKAIAAHLGTEHTELYLTHEDAMSIIPKLANLFDEPFSDSSQIPTFMVAKMARKEVTVVLTGDAADELFCGYNRYTMTTGLWSKIAKIPYWLRSVMARLIYFVPISYWNKINKILPNKLKMSNLGKKIHKGAGVLTARSLGDCYKGVMSHWQNPENVVIGAAEPATAINNPKRSPKLSDNIEQLMAIDSISYLPDDILTKVDRACMGVSLEGRIPFLNHKVVEFAWRLPFNYKLNNGNTKCCLKKVLLKHVPRELIERPKMGFGVPIGDWLRGPLKEWADILLSSHRLAKEGIFKPAPIATMWQEHLSGEQNWQHQLWDILMFQAWYEENYP